MSSFDISLVPGCKVCSRCSSQLSDILYGNTDNGNLSKSLPNLNAIDPISAEDSVPNEDCAELYNLNYNLTQVNFLHVVKTVYYCRDNRENI